MRKMDEDDKEHMLRNARCAAEIEDAVFDLLKAETKRKEEERLKAFEAKGYTSLINDAALMSMVASLGAYLTPELEVASLDWRFVASIKSLFDNELRDQRRRLAWDRAVMGSDDQLDEYMRKNRGIVVVRASTYKTILDRQWLLDPYSHGDVPPPYDEGLTPVLLRSSKHVAAFGMGWGQTLAWRYLRRIRYTCSDEQKGIKFLYGLSGEIERKVPCVSWGQYGGLHRDKDFYVGRNYHGDGGPFMVWKLGIRCSREDQHKVMQCPICRVVFMKRSSNQKTCSQDCGKERSAINAQRVAAAYAAMKELGLLKTEDLL